MNKTKQPCPGCGSLGHELPKPQQFWFDVEHKIVQQQNDEERRQLRLNGELAP